MVSIAPHQQHSSRQIQVVYKGKRRGVPTWHLRFLDSDQTNHSASFRSLGRPYRDHLVVHEDPKEIQARLRSLPPDQAFPRQWPAIRAVQDCSRGGRCAENCTQAKMMRCPVYREMLRQIGGMTGSLPFRAAPIIFSEKM